MQLEYLWKELQGYKSVINVLKNATSLLEASNIVLIQYERPADQSAAVQAQRAKFGQSYFDKYAGKVLPDTSVPEKSPEEITIDNAIADGIITGRQYWLEVLLGLITPSRQNIKALMEKIHIRLKKE